ncbi:restriction endonuclease subunit S [Planococcus plakortidis]|uniref:restriction endonuclease subunit S n=1 Tax=Planococcus plakortidis TaxID=1038856 RepID=UPI003984BC66
MNVPQLRFKGFEGEWKETKVGEILILLKSGLSRKLSSYNIGIPVIRSTNLVNGNLDLSDLAYWYRVDDQGAKIDNYILERGDILINFINSQAQIGKSCIYTSDIEAIYTTNIFRIKTSKEKSINEYFYYWTLTERYRKEIQNIVKPAVNQASFTTKEFNEIKYYLPSLKEQEKVADFFTLIDKKIEKQQEKIEKLEQFKKGMMQKIFSQELRFKDEDGGEFVEWEEKKLGQVLKIKHGKDQKKIENPNGKYPILATGGVIGRTDTFLYDRESVLIGRKGTIDKPVYMKSPFWTVDTLFYSEINSYNYSKFIFYTFQSINWKLYSEASGVPSLSAKTIEAIKVIVPSYQEQKSIGDYLSVLDLKIKKEQEKLKVFKQYKKAFIQKMLL